MNTDTIPARTLIKWTGIVVAAIVTSVVLWFHVTGFFLAPYVLLALIATQPKPTRITDEELEAWLRG